MILLAAALLASGTVAPDAPKPLFRDPVHDGAADPSTVYDPARRESVMFYTNRRADLPMDDATDVRWVHGTAIGIARSKDGAQWRYGGTAAIPVACTGATLWAPDVERFAGQWHMWVTVVPGIYRDWNAPRFLVHLTSRDLKHWRCGERVELGSDRVIDASVVALPRGGYRLFFNDERMNKAIRTADSRDLVHWTLKDRLTDTPGEAPKAFRWRGRWWLVSDAWKGLLVMQGAASRRDRRGRARVSRLFRPPVGRAAGRVRSRVAPPQRAPDRRAERGRRHPHGRSQRAGPCTAAAPLNAGAKGSSTLGAFPNAPPARSP